MLPLGTQMRGESVQIKLPCVPGENSFIVLFLRFNFTFAGGQFSISLFQFYLWRRTIFNFNLQFYLYMRTIFNFLVSISPLQDNFQFQLSIWPSQEDIHTSRIPSQIPPCNHLIHKVSLWLFNQIFKMLTFSVQTCFDDMLKSGHYACPVCGVKNLLFDEIRLNF